MWVGETVNVISCNFPLISHSSSFCVNLSTIIMKVESVTTVVGFFNAFFGLLFCGKVAPGSYTNLYGKPGLAVFAGFVSPLRFFVEGLAVSSSKCLPVQSSHLQWSDNRWTFIPLFGKRDLHGSYGLKLSTSFRMWRLVLVGWSILCCWHYHSVSYICRPVCAYDRLRYHPLNLRGMFHFTLTWFILPHLDTTAFLLE